MAFERDLYAWLKVHPQLQPVFADRWHPLEIPLEWDLPAVAYMNVAQARKKTQSGPNGKAKPRIQFSVVAETYDDMLTASKALRRALDGFKGVMGATRVDNVTLVMSLDAGEYSARGATRLMDFIFDHTEEV